MRHNKNESDEMRVIIDTLLFNPKLRKKAEDIHLELCENAGCIFLITDFGGWKIISKKGVHYLYHLSGMKRGTALKELMRSTEFHRQKSVVPSVSCGQIVRAVIAHDQYLKNERVNNRHKSARARRKSKYYWYFRTKEGEKARKRIMRTIDLLKDETCS